MSSVIDPKQAQDVDEEKAMFSFTLLISGVHEITVALEDALYGGACDDALISQIGNDIYVDFDRESKSWATAIMSAIEDVENCGLKLRVARVIPPGQDVIKDINAFLRLRDQPELKKRLTK